MTAAPQSCQPDIVERLRADTRSAAHCALSEEAADRIEELSRAYDQMNDVLIATSDRVEEHERTIDTLESNARVQAKLLADTGRRAVELAKAMQFIADGYDNHDVNHVDYRVRVYQVATEALAVPLEQSGSGK